MVANLYFVETNNSVREAPKIRMKMRGKFEWDVFACFYESSAKLIKMIGDSLRVSRDMRAALKSHSEKFENFSGNSKLQWIYFSLLFRRKLRKESLSKTLPMTLCHFFFFLSVIWIYHFESDLWGKSWCHQTVALSEYYAFTFTTETCESLVAAPHLTEL